MAEKLRDGTIAASAVYKHLGDLPKRMTRGSRDAPARGADTVEALSQGLIRAVREGWGVREGSAVELVGRLHAAGYIRHLPAARTAGMAMATMARLSPLVVEVRRGRYQILAGRPACLPEPILRSLVRELQGDRSADSAWGETPDLAAGFDRTAQDADPSSLPARAPGIDERARGVREPRGREIENLEDSSGEPWGFELDDPGAVACSPAPPVRAQQIGSEGTAAARPSDGGELVGVAAGELTRSGYLARVSQHRRIAQVGGLLLGHCDPSGIRGTARDVARVLAGYVPRSSARDRTAWASGLESLRQRGLAIEHEGRWYLPRFTVHPALLLLDVAEQSGQRLPSVALSNALRRRGIDPAGLSNEEAVALNRRLYTRRKGGKATVRQVAAIERSRIRAGLPPDLRASGRLDFAAARRALEMGMRRSMDTALRCDYEGDHG